MGLHSTFCTLQQPLWLVRAARLALLVDLSTSSLFSSSRLLRDRHCSGCRQAHPRPIYGPWGAGAPASHRRRPSLPTSLACAPPPSLQSRPPTWARPPAPCSYCIREGCRSAASDTGSPRCASAHRSLRPAYSLPLPRFWLSCALATARVRARSGEYAQLYLLDERAPPGLATPSTRPFAAHALLARFPLRTSSCRSSITRACSRGHEERRTC